MSEIEKTPLQPPDWQGKLRWFAAEFVIVVTGILAALGVDAWWSERAEREQESDLLAGLRAEFVANRDLFQRTMDMHRESIEQARQMLTLTGPEPGDFDPVKLDELLFPLLSEMPSFHPAMGEVEAMLGAGQLGLIRNQALRTAVAAWPGALSLLRQTEDEMREDVVRGFFPYILEKVPLVTLDHSVGFIDTPGPSRFAFDYRTLLSDVVFENHVENRWVMARFVLQDAEPVGELLDEIIGLLEAELGD